MSKNSPYFDLAERDSIATKNANEQARQYNSLQAKQFWGERSIPTPFANIDPGVATYNKLDRNYETSQASKSISTKVGGMPIRAI